MLKLAQAGTAPGKWLKRLHFSLAAPHSVALNPPPASHPFGPVPSHSWHVGGIPLLPLPTELSLPSLFQFPEAKISVVSRMRSAFKEQNEQKKDDGLSETIMEHFAFGQSFSHVVFHWSVLKPGEHQAPTIELRKIQQLALSFTQLLS